MTPDAFYLPGPILGPSEDGSAGSRESAGVWIVGGRFTFEDPGLPTATIRGYVVPGLVDMHCHIGLGPTGGTDRATAADQARADLATGVTLVRDMGSPIDTRFLEGSTSSPRIIRAGRHIARYKRYVRGYAHEVEPADLAVAAAAEARRGDGWVKLVGDWIDRSKGRDSTLEPLWPLAAVKEAVAATHAAGARISVHTFDTTTVGHMLEAGVDCIEHGTGMRSEHMAEAAKQGIPVVPTLIQIGNFATIAAAADKKYPHYAHQMRQMHRRRYEQVALMAEAGIQILVGTDAGGSVPHGLIANEARELVKAGLSSAEVVAAASWKAREFLSQSGISAGASADAVVYRNDPRGEIESLTEPVAVFRAGVRYESAPTKE